MVTVKTTAGNETASGWRWNYLGGGLIAVAFIGPSLATLAGVGNAFSVGQDITRTLGSLAFLALISWLVVRKKSDLAKAKARAVVGLLLCLTVGNNIANAARDKDQARSFLHQALAFQAQYSEKFSALGRRFDEVSVQQYLTPETLTSTAHIAAGKAVVERYRSLLQERNLLLQTYLAEYTSMVAGLPDGPMKAGAESTSGQSKQAMENLYTLLDRVQGKHASALEAVFDWAEANNGKITVQSGRLMFASVPQQKELQALVSQLKNAEDEVNAAVQKAQTAQVAAQEKNERLQKEAAEFLAK